MPAPGPILHAAETETPVSAQPDTAMILAAGFGTRMRPLTEARPKPLIPVAGRALIDHALDRVAAAGLCRAVINLHDRAEMIRAHLAGRTAPRLAFSEERPDILDTGGGVAEASRRGLLGTGPVHVLNSDAIWTGPEPLATLSAAWDGARMDALLLLVPRDRALNYTRAGDFLLEGGRPVRRGTAPAAPYVYTGAQILGRGAREGLPRGAFSLNRVWDALLARDRLAAVVHRGAWVDVGTPAGIAAAEAALAAAHR